MDIFKVFLCGIFLGLSQQVMAGREEASTAISNILFDNDMEDFSYYMVSEQGDVDITFDESLTDVQYVHILNQINGHSNISSVMASIGFVNQYNRMIDE